MRWRNSSTSGRATSRDSRPTISLLLLLTASSALWLLPSIGMAQEGEQGVRARVLADDPETDEREPVEGVSVRFFDQNGTELGSEVTNADGTAEIPLDVAGIYEVEIDAATIPEGTSLPNADEVRREANVQPGRFATVIFQLVVGEGGGGVSGSDITLRRVLQLSVDGVKLGLFLAMAAIGLSLIFGTTGLVNFAHAELVTWGMLVAYFFNVLGVSSLFAFTAGWPWILNGPVDLISAALMAVILGGLLGWAADAGVFARLRRRGTGLIAQMVITIGLSILIRYIYLYLFGGTGRFFRSYAGQQAIAIGPIAVTYKDIVAMTVALVALIGVGLTLQLTRAGRAMRAVSDDRDLAESSGIDVQRVIRWVWVAGAALAALGGVLLGQSDVIRWDVGSQILLLLFAGVILGGLGTAYGALVGCILVGLGIQLSTLFLASELRSIGALLLMIFILLIRPQGLMGRKERIG